MDISTITPTTRSRGHRPRPFVEINSSQASRHFILFVKGQECAPAVDVLGGYKWSEACVTKRPQVLRNFIMRHKLWQASLCIYSPFVDNLVFHFSEAIWKLSTRTGVFLVVEPFLWLPRRPGGKTAEASYSVCLPGLRSAGTCTSAPRVVIERV